MEQLTIIYLVMLVIVAMITLIATLSGKKKRN